MQQSDYRLKKIVSEINVPLLMQNVKIKNPIVIPIKQVINFCSSGSRRLKAAIFQKEILSMR